MIEGNATRLAGTRCRGSGLLACVAMCVVLLLALSTQASAQAPRPVPESPATSSTPAPLAPPSVAPAAADPSPGIVGVGHLPRDLSPWSMFASADIVVQTVMLGLAFASLVTWTVWLAKRIELFMARRGLRIALSAISEERTLAGAAARVWHRRGIAASFIA